MLKLWLLRKFYNILWLIALPYALLCLVWRSRCDLSILTNASERLGLLPDFPIKNTKDGSKYVIVHAISVGETRAAEPLITSLLASDLKIKIVLTHMTANGRKTGADVFAKHILCCRVQQVYLPYDVSWCIRNFLLKIKPSLIILIETEVWPNLMWHAEKLKIPVILANARLSAQSLRRMFGYKILHDAFSKLTYVLAQSIFDAKRLHKIGVDKTKIYICGNLKFKVQPDTKIVERGLALRKSIGAKRLVFCAASTRVGEEIIVLNAWQECKNKYPELADVFLLLVPRHPERCKEIVKLLTARGLSYALRSDFQNSWELHTINSTIEILIGDSLGEMPMYYAATDFVIMGGSLLPFGSQNLIEPCILGKPVILGAHTFNFFKASKSAISYGAAIQVNDNKELSLKISELLMDSEKRNTMGAAAKSFTKNS